MMIIRNAPQSRRDWISLWNFEIIMAIADSLSFYAQTENAVPPGSARTEHVGAGEYGPDPRRASGKFGRRRAG